MKKINLKFFTFLSIILLIGLFSLPSAAQVPHTVYGNLRYSNNETPNSINFSAYIITRPLDSLTVTSRHCGYDNTSSQWYIQCAEFNSSWSPGESLIIEFNDGNISTGADTVQLSSDPYDNADTATLYKPFRHIVIKTTPPDLNFTVDGKEYNHENIFKWEQESSHTLSIADVQYEGETIKYDFEAWNNGGKQTQKYVVSTSDDTLIAVCKTNYLLELHSKHGNPEGEGWYHKNETAFISIQSQEIIQKTKYLFNYWSGNLSSTDTSLIITMDTPKSLTAYWSIQHYLTLNSSHGNPQGEGWYNKNSQANFYVTTPDLKGKTRYIFQSWSGDYSGQFYNATILMDTSKTIQAGWNTEYYLTLEKNPDLGGTITPSPPGMWTEENDQIQISATPKTAYVFSKWTGDIEITENPTWLNMTTPLDVTAEFLKIADITITTNPPQQTIIIDGIEYTAPKTFKWVESTIHSITVKSPVYTEKDTRYIFDSWSNGGEINQSYVVSDQNETIIGSFKKQYHLTVDSEHGYPKGTGWYDINTEANFSVTNPDIQGDTRYIFKKWSGNYSGTNPSSSIIMSSPKTVSASWDVQYYLSVRNLGHGIVTGEGWYDQGQTATFSLYATNVSEGEGTRYIFSGWEGTGDGSYTGENQSHSVVMNNPIIEKVEWILQYFLYTQVNPALGGNISPAPPGNWYTVNEEAEITATPAPSYKFLFWTGDILGTTNPKTRIITEPTSVTANFSQLIEVTINTNPAGITFTADGEKYTSPHKFTWTKNSTHTIAADSIFPVDTGIRYTYNQWNHGEPREHVFTVPDDNTIITADYKLQYYLAIDSEDGNPIGQGWYFNGAKAEFSVDEFIIQGFTKKTFNRWTGDFMG
ncbi:MAG: PEGA domain-containing protein [bacterium]